MTPAPSFPSRVQPLRTLYFVRHGQSQANAGGVTMPHADIPLTELGRRHAQALAALLPPTPARVLCSRFVRAQHTARPYCQQLGLEPVVHPLLHEFETLDPDLIAGMDGEQRQPIVAGYWAEGDPHKRMGANAETFAEFALRVRRFMDEDMPALPDGTVLFGHGMWTGLLAWLLLGFGTDSTLEMRHFRRFQLGLPMPNGALYQLQELSPGHWRLRADVEAMRAVMAVQ